MTDFTQAGRILVTCAKAMPPILAAELRALGFAVDAELPAAVQTRGTLADTMRMNLWLRTAHRVLYLVDEFRAPNLDTLYRQVNRIPWEEWVPARGYLSVNSAVENETIRDTRIAGLKCKDAIVDRIRTRLGVRPDSGADQTGTVVFLYWQDQDAKVYVDTSGEPLSRRGYRHSSVQAPMQETLAAGVVLATGWNGTANFVNPMCGSGTLAIEAALLATGRAPAALRKNFGFRHLMGFQPTAWEPMRQQAVNAPARPFPGRIIATDIDRQAIDAARGNARVANVEDLIRFKACDFADTEVPSGGGVVLLNPEYGERMGDPARLEAVYSRIGDFFKQRCLGYTGYVFTGSSELGKRIGLRTSRRVPFFNSRIECRLLAFNLYEGRHRASPADRGATDAGGAGRVGGPAISAG